MEYEKDHFMISDDRSLLDVEMIHNFLKSSYWASNIPYEVVLKSLEHSLCFGVYDHKAQEQVGFARVVTDYATFAYLGDVFIVEAYRSLGLSKWLVGCIREHPDLQGLRRWILATRDAQALYTQNGFRPLANPDRWMEIAPPDVYNDPRA